MTDKFTMIQDTREQLGYNFKEDEFCAGMVREKLDTGDYSIVGMETDLLIERKKSVSELCSNMTSSAFWKEMERAKSYRWRFLICEFPFSYILEFPRNSGIPAKLWDKIKVTPPFLLKKILEIQDKYGVHVIYSGNRVQGMIDVMNICKYASSRK